MAVNYSAGLGAVGSYQVSGKPFVTGSLNATTIISVQFPSVTRWIQITNHDATSNLSCSFSANGITATNNFFLLPTPVPTQNLYVSSGRLELKCSEMFFLGSANFDIIAGLTGISNNEIANNWSGSAGI